MSTTPNFFRQLHRIVGYIEAGDGDTVVFFQDDATKDWCCRAGKTAYYAKTLEEVFAAALADANEYHKKVYDMEPV